MCVCTYIFPLKLAFLFHLKPEKELGEKKRPKYIKSFIEFYLGH